MVRSHAPIISLEVILGQAKPSIVSAKRNILPVRILGTGLTQLAQSRGLVPVAEKPGLARASGGQPGSKCMVGLNAATVRLEVILGQAKPSIVSAREGEVRLRQGSVVL